MSPSARTARRPRRCHRPPRRSPQPAGRPRRRAGTGGRSGGRSSRPAGRPARRGEWWFSDGSEPRQAMRLTRFSPQSHCLVYRPHQALRASVRRTRAAGASSPSLHGLTTSVVVQKAEHSAARGVAPGRDAGALPSARGPRRRRTHRGFGPNPPVVPAAREGRERRVVVPADPRDRRARPLGRIATDSANFWTVRMRSVPPSRPARRVARSPDRGAASTVCGPRSSCSRTRRSAPGATRRTA